MSPLAPSPRNAAPRGNRFASGEKVAVRPDEGTSRVPHPGPLPQLIAMGDVIAWWERENWIARGVR
jgi:hypothetical protein